MHLDCLHFEPVGGAAGDMILGALLDLGRGHNAVRAALDSLQMPGLSLELSEVRVGTERAVYVRSIAPSSEPYHRRQSDVFEMLDRAEVSSSAWSLARRIFQRLCVAEATVHGATAETVALHEVGQLDSILDVLGISVAIDELGNPEASCQPLPVGKGTVKTAHGLLDVPVPAVREIAASACVPLVDADLVGESVTPTGIAVLAEICSHFRDRPQPPPLAIGVGAGSRRFVARPNVLKVYGYREESHH